MLKIALEKIGESGLSVEGSVSSEVLDLENEDLIKKTGDIYYALNVQRVENTVIAMGNLWVELEVECAACLKPFQMKIEVNDFAANVELEGIETVDLTENVREDILLALPPHPHCDWDGQTTCEFVRPEPQNEPESEPEHRDVWGALNQLNFKPKN